LNTNLENNVKKHVDGLTMIDALTMNKCMKAVVGKFSKIRVMFCCQEQAI